MKSSILLVMVMAFIAACSPRPADNYKAIGDKRLRTTAPSRLFFNNIRQIDYRQLATTTGEPDCFLLDRWPEASELQLGIANHWLADEAYLQWLPAGAVNEGRKDSLLLLLLSPAGKSRKLAFAANSPVDGYEAGVLLYGALVNDGRLAILTPALQGQAMDTLSVWEDAASQRAAVVVLSDYFRLVERSGF